MGYKTLYIFGDNEHTMITVIIRISQIVNKQKHEVLLHRNISPRH